MKAKFGKKWGRGGSVPVQAWRTRDASAGTHVFAVEQERRFSWVGPMAELKELAVNSEPQEDLSGENNRKIIAGDAKVRGLKNLEPARSREPGAG